MQRPSTAALLLRAMFVFLTVCSLIIVGVVLDRLAGSSPVGVLSFLIVATTFGVIMLCVLITSSFPTTGGDGRGGDPGA